MTNNIYYIIMLDNKTLAIQRIDKDIKEIIESPIEGIGITSIDDDPMKYVVNMRIMEGIYEGYYIQLLLLFPDNYPKEMPKILIFPNQEINEKYNSHISYDYNIEKQNGDYFQKFDNSLYDQWTPFYGISDVLLNVHTFLSYPDMYNLSNRKEIEILMKSIDNYKWIFKIKNGEDEITKVHTWKNPYPEMFFKNNKKEEFVEEKKKEMTGIEIIKKELTCPVYKINYLDNPDISFGYEVNYIDDIDIIPVFISYQGYKIRIEHYKKDFDNTYWLHLYINKNHYEKNKTEILNTLNQIKSNIKDNDFKSEIIPEIFPIIINNYILSCQKKLKYSLWIKGYFHIFLLFKKLCLDYEKDYLAYLNHQLNLIAKNNYGRK